MNDQTAIREARKAVKSAGGLWTTRDLAEAIGASKQAVQDRLDRGTLPDPAFTLPSGQRVWLGRQLPREVRRGRR